jgi:hypothetical protein
MKSKAKFSGQYHDLRPSTPNGKIYAVKVIQKEGLMSQPEFIQRQLIREI